MKQRILLFVFFLLSTLTAKAYDAYINGIYYDFNSSTKEAAVTYGSSKYTGNVTIPTAVTYNSVAYNVTTIKEYAFYNCSGMTSLTIPNSVTLIENYAFYNCVGDLIVNCKIPSASQYYNGTFYGSKFGSVKIGNGVETIGNYAFSDCSSIKSLTIPNSTTAIGDCAFSGCSGLTGVTIPNSVTSIGKSAFVGCSGMTAVTIPNSVTSIGTLAFYDCTGELTVNCNIPSESSFYYGTFRNSKFSSVKIGEGVETVGNYAFAGCSNLTSISIPNSVTSIGKDAFFACSSITSIMIGSGNSVYDSRNNCNAIIETASNTLITGCNTTLIPNSVTSIGDYSFFNCSELTEVTIPNSVTSIGHYAFADCKELTSVTIPNSVISIGSSAFVGCSGMTYITVESGNTIYDSRDNCNAIINTATNTLLYGSKSTVIPNSVTSIGYSAFRGLSGLTEMAIPSSINSIGDYAFADCNELKSILVKMATPINIDTDIFSDSIYKNTVLYVPTGRKTYFEDATGWGIFANIQEMDMPDVKIIDSPYANVDKNQIILGYYTSEDISESGYGGRNAGLYKVCIGFSREQMIPFAGNNITNVRFALKDTDIADLKLWIGSTRDKKDLYSQGVTSPQVGWNEIKLNSPCEITGDSIFIGIEYKQSDARWPVSVVSEGAELGSSYFYGPYYGADNDGIWLEPDESESLSIQCIVEGDKIPMYDLHTTRLSFYEKYVQTGNGYYTYLYLRNWGKKSINNATIACEIDGVEVSTGTVSSVSHNIQSKYLYFKVGDVTPGKHKLTLRVKDINGDTPEFPSDDAQSVYVKSYSQDMGRDKVMLELYTATWCPNTPRAHKSIAALMEERDDIVLVSNHLSDVMSCDASDAYSVFTNYTPTIYYDRYASYGATSLGYIGVDGAKALPSLAKLNISARYDENNRQLTIKVNGVKNEEFDIVEEYANLTVLLTEDGIIYPQNDRETGKYINDYVHNGVLRTNVSEIWGDPVTWTGDKFEKTYTIRLNDGWVKDNMHVVAFLAKPFTGRNYEDIGLVNCNEFLLKNAKTTEDEILPGDVNGDGVVNGTDIQAIINLIVAGEFEAKADINNDGIINGTDIQEVINIIVEGE